MKILITGGTGFLGSTLCQSLLIQGHEVSVLSRHCNSVTSICGSTVKAIANFDQLTAKDDWQAIINLAGAPIFDAQWSTARKQLIRSSRIDFTNELVKYLSSMNTPPEVLISGSAIGYYGNQGDNILTEQSNIRTDFSQQLCSDWEQAAMQAENIGVRVCLIRTGLVLGHGGGLLQRMLVPFRLGFGGRLGNGKQWMSWIHRQDWLAMVEIMLNDKTMRGAYNATAPNPVTNEEFTKTLADCLKRPALLPLPGWLLNKILSERAELILGSQRVLPERLLAHGYQFLYPDLISALNEVLSH